MRTRRPAQQLAFRDRLAGCGVTVRSVTSPGDLETALLQALNELPHPTPVGASDAAGSDSAAEEDGIPAPPQLYAEPAYIGSHTFVGRRAQLDALDDWAGAANPHPVLLFEAIGGTGKSMLTWEWVTHHVHGTRPDWAGVLWYSFYERGAVMADFCRRALAYTTGRPRKDFAGKKQAELSELLVRQLQARPWLVVLDGLERVLVAYHRIDAAQLADEHAGTEDQIAERDPCAAIHPADEDLLRSLTATSPSKILITSRLVPRVLLNPAGQPRPGVVHERLPGLRPADAELRSCGVEGDSQRMREFLQRHCDCHPLVTGIVAGLISHYLPARGDFDAWSADPDHGARLDVSGLDLVQKRNHILRDALAALSDPAAQLLSMLALLSEAVDYPTLAALNPHLPPEPIPVGEPADPPRSPRGICCRSACAARDGRPTSNGWSATTTTSRRCRPGAPPRMPPPRPCSCPPRSRIWSHAGCCNTTRRPDGTTCTRSCAPSPRAGCGTRSWSGSGSGWSTTSPRAPTAPTIMSTASGRWPTASAWSAPYSGWTASTKP